MLLSWYVLSLESAAEWFRGRWPLHTFFLFLLFFFVFFLLVSHSLVQISAVVVGGMVKKGDFIEYDRNWGLRRGALRPFVFGVWACWAAKGHRTRIRWYSCWGKDSTRGGRLLCDLVWSLHSTSSRARDGASVLILNPNPNPKFPTHSC